MARRDFASETFKLRREKNKTEKNNQSKKSEETQKKTRDFATETFKVKKEISLGLDTLPSDLTTLSKTIDNVYNGWQTQETMKNTLSSVQSMYDRLGKYQEYYKQYGGTDLGDLRKAYKGVLDEWDAISSDYAPFKNADSYKAEKDTLKKLSSMKSSEVKKYIDDAPNIDGWLNTAKNYESKLNSNALDKFNLTSIGRIDEKMRETPNGAFDVLMKGIKTDNPEATKKEYDEFLKGIGYNSIKDLNSAKSGIAYTTASGENITWKSLYDTKKETEEHQKKYGEISSRDDFEKFKTEGASIKNPTLDEYNLALSFNGKRLWGKGIENKLEFYSENKTSPSLLHDSGVIYAEANQEEKDLYNYYLGREKAGLEKEGTADGYLESIKRKLQDRYENKVISSLSGYADEHPVSASVLSVGQNLLSGGEWLLDSANYLKTGELDDNFLARSSSTIRSSVSDKYDWNIDFLDGWDAFDFVYNTGMSMADSAAAMVTMGGAGGVALGLSAAAQGTNDALERGLDNKSAFWSGLTSGVFEGLFESVSIGKFKSLKDAPVDGVKSLIKNVGKSMLTNASEETLTELANLTYDYFANGDLSQYATQVRAYMSAGLSEKEAIRKVALEQAAQVAEAGASGALMGFGFGVTGGTFALMKNSSVGSNIKSNDRVSELLDLVSNPEIGTAYEAYTQYANKGINSDNIKNAQLGSLYTMAKGDALSTMHDKKASGEQKVGAFHTLAKIAEIDSPSDAKLTDSLNKTLNKKNKKVESDVDIETTRAETLKNVTERLTKLGEEGDISKISEVITKRTLGEDITTEELKLLKDSDYGVRVFNESIEGAVAYTNGMSNAEANLFWKNYDEKTDIEAYATSFNLMKEYANKPDGFSTDDVLKNKGVLSTEAATNIYNGLFHIADLEQAEVMNKQLQSLAKKNKGKTGNIDDSIINYGDKYMPGKVNWKALSKKQKQAFIYTKGLFQALGSNVVFVGKNKDFNGAYSVGKDTIYIDVYAGVNLLNGKGDDVILNTVSHEITHQMRVKAYDGWKHMSKLVLDGLEKTSGKTRNEIIAEEVERLKKNGNPHTDEDAIDEIVARACEEMLSMSKEARSMFESLTPAEQNKLVSIIKDIIQKITDWIDELLKSYGPHTAEAKSLREDKERYEAMSMLWDKMLREVQGQNKSVMESVAEVTEESPDASVDGEITSIGSRDLTELSEAVDEDGKMLFQYRAMEEDKDIYREMLLKHKKTIGITNKQITELFDMIDKAIDIISKDSLSLEALDYSWDADINDRAFNPIKPNSDSLYKVSLDFSTLCRKRLLQQTIQTTLQEALNKNLSKEESIAIRDELMKLQEEGRKIEIACALCYVESARMKSPVQINKFLNNKESILREFFANKDESTKAKVDEAEMKAREILAKKNPKGFKGKNNVKLDALTAPKSAKYKKDADFIRDSGKKVKAEYKFTEAEQKKVDAALKMSAVDFTSAKGLENLAKNHPDIFDAYTSFVRNATHSKGLESDVWWRAGDSDAIGENLIEQMNEENGLRSQSWSDFQVIHLLDYIAATIELSAKGAKRQSYTKVPDYVKLLGNTGDMINMSVIPDRAFSGKLGYDDVEGMAYKVATELRKEYHKTAGIICIGIDDTQIRMLLDDVNIDMVIPYHASSISKAVRKLMHIPEWKSYQSYQSESKLKDTEAKANAEKYGVELKTDDKLYQKAPKFSEWFDIDEARQIADYENKNPSDKELKKKYGKMYGGYMAMQNAANTYLKLCAERGLAPKFSHEKADFTNDANYWKLLIDRKMVDNVTGEIIEQEAIKPIFKEESVLEILNDELARYPEVKADQEYAQRVVTEKFLSGDMKMDKSTREAIKKPIDNITKVNILESAEEGKLKHSDRDSEGNTLSEGQQEYFKDSKIRDENGNLLVVYHGTSKGGFTQFDTYAYYSKFGLFGNGAYFTDNKEIAETYTRKGRGSNPQVYSVYLNITNPIDMDAKANIEAWNKALQKTGEDFELLKGEITNEQAFKSMVEDLEYAEVYSYDAAEIVRNVFENMGYDGITHIGGGRVNRSDGTKHRVFIAFEPEQIKETTNKNPTSDKDIRYADRDDTTVYDLMGEKDRLINENKKLREDFERLKERLKIERQVTKGNHFNENQLGTVAGHLRNISNSNMDKVELIKALKDVYSFIVQTKELTWEDVYERCYRVAEKMLAESKPEVEVDYFSKQILRDIRNTRVSLNDSQKAEAQHIFGKNWNRYFFNRVTITDKGIPIESMWQDWAEQYPHLFSEETTPNDMLSELYDIIGSLREASETIIQYKSEEETRWLANEIYNQYWNVSPIRTTADKYDKQIKLLNFEHRRAMKESRDAYEERLAEQKKTDRAKYTKLAKEIRERRDRDVARAKELGRQRLESFKENAEKKTQIQKITADVMSLKELLVKNSKDKHVPEVLKGPVRTLIQAIDFSSKRLIEKGIPTQKDISLQNALRQVTDMMASTNSALEGVVDMYGIGLDSKMADMMKSVDRIVASIGTEKFTLQMMSAEELKTLATMTKVIKASVNSLNKFHVAHHNAGVLNLAFETAEEVDAAKKMHKNNKKHFDKLKTKTYWNNLTPYYAFKNLGKAAQKIFTAFQDGQDKVAFLAKEIIDFTEGLYTTKEYKKWNETFFDFEIKQPDGKIKKVSMNVPQIMSLYCVAKQEDALNHILHGVEDDKGNKGKGRGITLAETDTTEAVLTNILLTEADLKEITSKLDEVDRAKEVADELQKFMSTRGAELGNEVSMVRWGIKSFGIENYFPIKVSDGSAPKKNDTPGVQGNPLLSLLNASFTHARTLNAPQSIEIGNVFDVFANHMASMIQYNAMALPVLDMYKWLNAQGVDEIGNEISLMTSIRSTFGDEAWSYFNTFLKDVNGATKSQRRDNWAIKFFKNSKIAKVAANIRVVALQFTSYIRAGSVMDNKYLLRALVHKPKIQKSEEHCGMVLWKSLGYFNTDISSPLANKIKHVESIKDKITDLSLKGAEWADKITLGYLWNACELEVRDTRKDLQVGSDEFNKEIALRLRDVIYRTQVVDSQLTRSQMMRSPETWDKMLTTFASESTLSFNLITDIYVSYKLDSRRMGKEKAKEKHGKYMRKAIIAYTVTNIATSMIASVFDAFRDYDEDDKDEEYWLKLMLGNLATDFSFINKIPYLNLFISAIQGFGASRTDAEWMEESVKAVKQLYKFMTGEGSGEKALKSVLKAASDITGVAGYNLYRDIRAFIEMFDD